MTESQLSNFAEADAATSPVADAHATPPFRTDASDSAVQWPLPADETLRVAPVAAVGETPRAAPFVVELASYSGPLDLLLTLIRDEQVDVYDIPIARVAKQFLARVHSLGLDEAADYLEMAARLLRIKAQMLLPRPESDEAWEDPRSELVRRLLEYQQMREVVDVLERLGEDRRNRFARAYLPQGAPVAAAATVLSLSLPDLLAAVDRILRLAKEPTVHTVIARALDVAGAITTVRAVLGLRARARWSDVVTADAEPWQVLSVLLALLEMAKSGECRLVQPKPFASVEITRDVAGEAA